MKLAILSGLSLCLAALGFLDTAPVVERAAEPVDPCSLARAAEYEGAQTCKKCHFRQHLSWKKTKMAKTFEVLKPGKATDAKAKHGLDANKDYTKDASCLPCHTTGYGKPGGYPEVVAGKAWTDAETKRAKKLEGVQCESCHGPGSLTSAFKKDNEHYKKADLVSRGLVEPNADNCKECHNENSPTIDKATFKFDYQALIKDPKKIHKHVKLKHKH